MTRTRLSQLGTPGLPGPSSGHWLPLLVEDNGHPMGTAVRAGQVKMLREHIATKAAGAASSSA